MDSTTNSSTHLHCSIADPDTIRRALGPGSALASTLKVCMVNPDNATKTRYVLGGQPRTTATGMGPGRGEIAPDQLEGEVRRRDRDDDYHGLW